MSIKETLKSDLTEAMKARAKEKLAALRLITAAIKQVEVDERIEVDDARLLIILDKLAKQRNESITQFKLAGRNDLVDQEVFELDLIRRYLPQPLSEEAIAGEIEKAMQTVAASQMSDMGKVMAHLKPILQGRADMAKVSALIKSRLNPS